MSPKLETTISVTDMDVFHRVQALALQLKAIVEEYAQHGDECPLADGWGDSRPDCLCGLDRALEDVGMGPQ